MDGLMDVMDYNSDMAALIKLIILKFVNPYFYFKSNPSIGNDMRNISSICKSHFWYQSPTGLEVAICEITFASHKANVME